MWVLATHLVLNGKVDEVGINRSWYDKHIAYALISFFLDVSMLNYGTSRRNEIEVYALGTLVNIVCYKYLIS